MTRIADTLRQGSTFSFEFFPPKSETAGDALFKTISELQPLKPSFVSVTYGAGGSTRDVTRDLVVRLRKETSLPPMPHLTCVGHEHADVEALLTRYADAGITDILALRGDDPTDGSGNRGAFPYAADLIRFIRTFDERRRDRPSFGIGVAGFPEGHPGTPNRLLEMDHLKRKVDEGADFIITQLFFNNRDFYDFRDRCTLAGIRVPIIAGIMPITSAGGMARMAELALGMRYPASLLRAIRRTGDDAEGVSRVGAHWATEQCRDLLDHDVAGIHFYTLNKSSATRDIYRALGVRDSRGLRG